MKIEMIKHADGYAPVSDLEADRIKRFKNGEQYTVEIKLTRNPKFHRMVFGFFGFCFQYWSANQAGLENMDEYAQLNTFRKHLTVLAGYFDTTISIDGGLRVEARSLAYGSMKQEEFELVYSALINAAIKNVFNNTTDQVILDKLYSFF
ncbi:NinB-like protein [Shewanella sp. phage 3/49]|uniref:NinB/ Orf homologous recombination mediator n=1 Tax=Shewanella sp. phage 3/49 TaxID=1458863 RepID=UPI0004F8659E|nr:NinB/ Orf homologous recombination mediator [Shewanella sp. phage 3/49]AHK11845.1 NinB-like protein [Shewanella sp. phage 3/49]